MSSKDNRKYNNSKHQPTDGSLKPQPFDGDNPFPLLDDNNNPQLVNGHIARTVTNLSKTKKPPNHWLSMNGALHSYFYFIIP